MSKLLNDKHNNDRRERHDVCIRCMTNISLAGDLVDGNRAVRDSELNSNNGQRDAMKYQKFLMSTTMNR